MKKKNEKEKCDINCNMTDDILHITVIIVRIELSITSLNNKQDFAFLFSLKPLRKA